MCLLWQFLFPHFRLKSHQVDEDNSESDDDEFTGKGVVFDSDEEEEVCLVQVKSVFTPFSNPGSFRWKFDHWQD